MHNIFNTKYPIVCAPMFQINDCNLALAVYNAGCFPTFAFPTVGFDSKKFAEVQKFINITNSQNFSIFMDIKLLDKDNFDYVKIVKHSPKFIEIGTSSVDIDEIKNILNKKSSKYFLKHCINNNIKLIMKASSIIYEDFEHFDIINIKGSESAGRYSNKPIKEIFLEQKKIFPNKFICPSGGIATGEDIDWFLENGAAAIYMGSAFALTKESRINNETKNKILKSTSNDLIKFLDTKHNAFIIDGNSKHTNNSNLDSNRTNSLILGIENLGGHVYMGQAIDKINDLLTVDELVKKLVANSKYLNV